MRKLLVLAMLFLGIGLSVARADILNPIGTTTEKTAATAFDSSTLLADTAQVINYLGVKEGEAYSWEQNKFVTTTSATIVTYAPWNLSLDVSMLNADGVTADLAYNLGALLPVANVPVLKYTQYLYVFGGIGGEENNAGTAFKLAPVAGIDFKFSF